MGESRRFTAGNGNKLTCTGIMSRWTKEARQQQAERMRALCPWTKSMGPKTEEGKARSARNAWKGGVRADAAAYAKILRGIAGTTRRLFSSFRQKHAFSPSTITQPLSTRPFSSFGRKRGGNVQHRTGEGGEFILASIGNSEERSAPAAGSTPLLEPSLPAAPGLSSSFGQKWDSLPDSDPELEALSNEEFMAVAAGLLGGGLFSSFGVNSEYP